MALPNIISITSTKINSGSFSLDTNDFAEFDSFKDGARQIRINKATLKIGNGTPSTLDDIIFNNIVFGTNEFLLNLAGGAVILKIAINYTKSLKLEIVFSVINASSDSTPFVLSFESKNFLMKKFIDVGDLIDEKLDNLIKSITFDGNWLPSASAFVGTMPTFTRIIGAEAVIKQTGFVVNETVIGSGIPNTVKISYSISDQNIDIPNKRISLSQIGFLSETLNGFCLTGSVLNAIERQVGVFQQFPIRHALSSEVKYELQFTISNNIINYVQEKHIDYYDSRIRSNEDSNALWTAGGTQATASFKNKAPLTRLTIYYI